MSEYIYEHVQSGADHMGKQVELPTLVQRKEIVRCRDCAYYEPNTYSHFTCELLTYHAEQDGFCAWGERGIDG